MHPHSCSWSGNNNRWREKKSEQKNEQEEIVNLKLKVSYQLRKRDVVVPTPLLGVLSSFLIMCWAFALHCGHCFLFKIKLSKAHVSGIHRGC
jgi:hypothetical protein